MLLAAMVEPSACKVCSSPVSFVVSDMRAEKPENRQMACAVLHNLVPHLTLLDSDGNISDVAVQVCGTCICMLC